jgi:hypothetical protein
MEWVSITRREPVGEVLIYSAGRFYIAMLVKDDRNPVDRGDFMEVDAAKICPWPSYWMPLPPPPLN